VDPLLYREIACKHNRPEILRLLVENPDIPDEVRQQAAQILNVPVKQKTEIVRVRKSPKSAQTILQEDSKLSASERILLVLKGGKEMTILLRDNNKEVSLTVLDNPKLTETEIELIARSRSISDEALRKITKKREWMKTYGVIYALATNPKTPPGIAVQLVRAEKRSWTARKK
jgi:hypothetical protein